MDTHGNATFMCWIAHEKKATEMRKIQQKQRACYKPFCMRFAFESINQSYWFLWDAAKWWRHFQQQHHAHTQFICDTHTHTMKLLSCKRILVMLFNTAMIFSFSMCFSPPHKRNVHCSFYQLRLWGLSCKKLALFWNPHGDFFFSRLSFCCCLQICRM